MSSPLDLPTAVAATPGTASEAAPEPPPKVAPVVDDAAVAELEHSVRALRRLFQMTLVALVVVLGAGSLVLWQRVRQVRRESAALSRMVGEFDRLGQPQLEAFLHRLKDFARTNPDFIPIFNKYIPPTTNAPAAGAAVSVPSAPGAPAKAPGAPAKAPGGPAKAPSGPAKTPGAPAGR